MFTARAVMATGLLIAATPLAPGGSIYWTSDTADAIFRANSNGQNIVNLVSNTSRPLGLALDTESGFMYWSEREGGIMRARLDGSDVMTLVPLAPSVGPRGVALHKANGKLYWATDSGRIMHSNLDGSGVYTIVDVQRPGIIGVTVNNAGTQIYWADSEYPGIFRANIDGSNAQAIVDVATVAPYYVDLDEDHGYIYWTDFWGGAIFRSEMDGGDVIQLVSMHPRWPIDLSIDHGRGKLYWTIDSGMIQRSNLDGSQIENVVTDLPAVWAVEIQSGVPAPVPATTPRSAIAAIALLLGMGAWVLSRAAGRAA